MDTKRHSHNEITNQSPAPATQELPEFRSVGRRPMRKLRFAFGLTLSTAGVAIILAIAFGSLQSVGVRGQISLPAVGLCVILGVMLLGGGFGLMATSAPGFDEDEFNRLMQAGDSSAQRPDTVSLAATAAPEPTAHNQGSMATADLDDDDETTSSDQSQQLLAGSA